jgi:sugar (pentulose or hexulose) kinase
MKVLAFDFGASSGRAILGIYENGKLSMEEVHRFPNDPVMVNGTFYWDILRLFHEIKQGISKCVALGHSDLSSIGIDTWGVDFGLLDADGRLLENPVHYRDKRTDGIMEKTFETCSQKKIYDKTGIQFMFFNTIFQLNSLKLKRPDILNRTETLLFAPDLLSYFLTGEKNVEYTIASTSQLLDAKKRDLDRELIEALGFKKSIFPKIIKPGTVRGRLTAEIAEELGVGRIDVIACASHDTASAVVSAPIQRMKKAAIYPAEPGHCWEQSLTSL